MKKQLLPLLLFIVTANILLSQTILGIDVNHLKNDINWQQVRAAGKAFAYTKATEGVIFIDPNFTSYMTNGKSAGVIMGAYHFARPDKNNTAVNEANYFLNIARAYIGAGKLPPALDLEDPPNNAPALSTLYTKAALTSWVQDWMTTVQNATGVAPILYTNSNYAQYLNKSLNSYNLWIANPNTSATTAPTNTGVWTNWAFKQYSWMGTVSGINSSVDLDVFNGNAAAFNSLIGANSVACTGWSVNTPNIPNVPATGNTYLVKVNATAGTNCTYTASTLNWANVTASSAGIQIVVPASTVAHSDIIYVNDVNGSSKVASITINQLAPVNTACTGWSVNTPNIPNVPATGNTYLVKVNATAGTNCTYTASTLNWANVTASSAGIQIVVPASTVAHSDIIYVNDVNGSSKVASITINQLAPVTCITPPEPITTYGETFCPGTSTSSIPTLTWSSTASSFWPAVSQYPFESQNLVYNPINCITGNSVQPTFKPALQPGMVYRWSIKANGGDCSSSACNSTENNKKIFFVPPTISPSTPQTICSSGKVQFSTTPVSFIPGANAFINYQWFKDNTLIPNATNTTYDATTSGSYYVRFTFTGSTICSKVAIGSPAVTVTVSNTTIVSASANPLSITTGQKSTLTATGGGVGATYSWNTTPNQNGASIDVFPTSTTTYIVTVTNSAGCTASSQVTVQVNSGCTTQLTPSVTVTQQPMSICAGQNATFSATPTNEGNMPTYQWQINSIPQQGNAASFSSNTLAPGDQVTCILTSNANCLTTATATNTIPVKFNQPTIPSVSITASALSICAGQNVTFTATPINGGNLPSYQWFVNGTVIQGETSPIFSSSTLADGSIVGCTMVSNDGCASTVPVPSSTKTITFTTAATPSVKIDASVTTICSNQNVSFKATATLGGNLPTYQWFVNDVPQTETTENFSSSSLIDGAVVYCKMTSNATCIIQPTVTSTNKIIITVKAGSDPKVIITPNNNSICFGKDLIFTATPTNAGGTSPTFQWYVDGTLQSENSATFTASKLTNGSQVYCVMTSNADCISMNKAPSAPETIKVSPVVTPTVTITPSANPICLNQSISFTASPTNGGSSPVFEWYINNVLKSGSGITFSPTNVLDGDEVICKMTSSADCATPQVVSSSFSKIKINILAKPILNLSKDTISSTNFKTNQYSYNWFFNNNLVSNEPYVLCKANGNGNYSLIINFNGCQTKSDVQFYNCTVSTTNIINDEIFTIYPNPTSSLLNIESKITNLGRTKVILCNVLGQRLEEKEMVLTSQGVSTQFNFQNFASGTYLIFIYSNSSQNVFKVQKN